MDERAGAVETGVTSKPYVEASFTVGTDREVHQLPARELAKVVVTVLGRSQAFHGKIEI